MISKIIFFLFFLLVTFSTGYTILNERNDVTCLSSLCYRVRYQLYKNGTNYKMAIHSKLFCDISACDNCTYKGDWSLIQSAGKYYVTRKTYRCKAEQRKNYTDFFTAYPYQISDILCSPNSCSRCLYSSVSDGYLGSCDNSDCHNCFFVDMWSDNTINGKNMLTRATSHCNASTLIAMESFFTVPNITNSRNSVRINYGDCMVPIERRIPDYPARYDVISERNDVTCSSSLCYRVRYQLYKNGTNYRMAIYSKSFCDISACENCTYKGNWSLIELAGKYYVTRKTYKCKAEQRKHFTDIFTYQASEISDIVCSPNSCTKCIYVNSGYLGTGYLGPCNKSDCHNCYFADMWSPINGESIFTRSTSRCSAPTLITMESFFIVSITNSSDTEKRNLAICRYPIESSIPDLDGYIVYYWSAERIVAVVIICISFITIIIVLFACFCCCNK